MRRMLNSIVTPARGRSSRTSCPKLRRTAVLGCLLVCMAGGCTLFDALFGPLPINDNDTTPSLGIAIAEPAAQVTAAPGVTTRIRWADIAKIEGTVVRLTAQRRNTDDEDTADPIHLIGDGTPGSGRDALADGDNDIFEWDITGVRVGTYVIIATIEAPDGESKTVQSRDPARGTTGVIVVTTALPVPTLSFTAPGNANETVTTGNTFIITWTDNGAANPDAVILRLGLDADTNHSSGNEIILVRNQLLSENGNSGSFVFNFQDESGATVPDGTYNVFAVVDDGVNDPVTSTATGKLVLNP